VDKNKVILTSSDRDVLGQTAAKLRELRAPEPYKGKGVKYSEEVIKRKVGKAGATGGGGK
jgi:large subunit ribosomal protein L6